MPRCFIDYLLLLLRSFHFDGSLYIDTLAASDAAATAAISSAHEDISAFAGFGHSIDAASPLQLFSAPLPPAPLPYRVRDV